MQSRCCHTAEMCADAENTVGGDKKGTIENGPVQQSLSTSTSNLSGADPYRKTYESKFRYAILPIA